jgi:hypothetical protein
MSHRARVCLAILTFFFLSAAPAATFRHKTTHLSLEGWRELLAEVESRPGMKCENHDYFQYICDTPNPLSIWVFTRPGHPAHPAATQGVMVMPNGVIDIDRIGFYAGDQFAYERWMKEFITLDARQIEVWEKYLNK